MVCPKCGKTLAISHEKIPFCISCLESFTTVYPIENTNDANLTLLIKPLSINVGFQGRRFKTKECKQWENAVGLILKKYQQRIDGWIDIRYVFYLTNFGNTDVFNLEKLLTDLIVKRGIIKDDRYIVEGHVKKIRDKEDWVEVFITKIDVEGEKFETRK
jgi:Holliday junction resolvase RusA-like endonuclease